MDYHNAMGHDVGTKQQVGLDDVRITHRWYITVFTFSIACIEVNGYLCLKYFINNDE